MMLKKYRLHFSGKNDNPGFSFKSQFFFCIFVCWLRSEKLFSDVVKQILLKNSHIHNLNLLNFVSVVVFDVETALQNAKLEGILQSSK